MLAGCDIFDGLYVSKEDNVFKVRERSWYVLSIESIEWMKETDSNSGHKKSCEELSSKAWSDTAWYYWSHQSQVCLKGNKWPRHESTRDCKHYLTCCCRCQHWKKRRKKATCVSSIRMDTQIPNLIAGLFDSYPIPTLCVCLALMISSLSPWHMHRAAIVKVGLHDWSANTSKI